MYILNSTNLNIYTNFNFLGKKIPLNKRTMIAGAIPVVAEIGVFHSENNINSNKSAEKEELTNNSPLETVKLEDETEILVPQADTELKKRDEFVNSEIQRILTEVTQYNLPVTYSSIAKRVGITPSNCCSRISNNENLSDLFSKIQHSKNTSKTEKINGEILRLINEAKEQGRTISYSTIAQMVNMTRNAVAQKILYTPKLKAAMAEIGYSKISEESQDINEKIENILWEAIFSGSKIRKIDIAQMLEISFLTVRARLKAVPFLAALWAKTPHKTKTANKSDEVATFDLKIQNILDSHIERNIPTQIKEIAEELHVPYAKVRQRIENNPKLTKKWKITPRKNLGAPKDSTQGENQRLIEIMENYIAQKRTADANQISKEAGMSSDKFRARLKRFPDVRKAWDRLKTIEKTKNIFPD